MCPPPDPPQCTYKQRDSFSYINGIVLYILLRSCLVIQHLSRTQFLSFRNVRISHSRRELHSTFSLLLGFKVTLLTRTLRTLITVPWTWPVSQYFLMSHFSSNPLSTLYFNSDLFNTVELNVLESSKPFYHITKMDFSSREYVIMSISFHHVPSHFFCQLLVRATRKEGEAKLAFVLHCSAVFCAAHTKCSCTAESPAVQWFGTYPIQCFFAFGWCADYQRSQALDSLLSQGPIEHNQLTIGIINPFDLK